MTNKKFDIPKPEGIKEPEDLDFKIVHESLEKIYLNILHNLEKEPFDPRTYFIIANILKTCYQTYKLITNLVADDKERKYPIQAHMLTRTIMDAFFVVMALLDDSNNTRKYELAGFRDMWVQFEEEKIGYEGQSDAEVYLNEKEKSLQVFSSPSFLNLTPEEIANPKENIKFWPIPNQMVKSNSNISLSQDRLEFLKLIIKWHYKQPSELNHISFMAIIMKVFVDNPDSHWFPGKFESDAVYSAQLFLLMMLSEIESEKKYGAANDMRFLWTLLGGFFKEVEEYYQVRYKTLLPE